MILISHLRQLISKLLPVLHSNRPNDRSPQQLQPLTHRSIRRQTTSDVEASSSLQRLTIVISEDLREAVQKREAKGSVIAVQEEIC